MSYYHNNYGRQDYSNRINEEDVPESKHTIFIRGLPGNMTTDEVKSFFEDKIGPCSFDFTKVSQDRSRLFVAVRFETREDAKECLSRYKNDDIMGYTCDLQWFRDIRRYASYQAAQQGSRYGSAYNARGLQNRGRQNFVQNRNNYNGNRSFDNRNSGSYDRKRRRSNSRDSRSASRDSSHSRSRSRSRSRSTHASRSRSRSSSRESRESCKIDESKGSRESSADRDSKKKKDRKDKKKSKKDKKRSRRSHSNDSSGSDGELKTDDEKKKDRDLSRSSRRSRSKSVHSPKRTVVVVQRDRSESPEVNVPVQKEDIKIKLKGAAALVQNTTFKVGLDSDESPKRLVRKITPEPRPMSISPAALEEPPKAPILPPPPLPPSFKEKETSDQTLRRGKFRPIESEPLESSPPVKKERTPDQAIVDKDPTPPPVKTNFTPPPQPKSVKIDRPSAPRTMKVNKYPVTTKLFADLKQFQSNLISGVKAEQQEEDGGLRLSSLTTLNDEDDEIAKLAAREQALASLDEMQLERLAIRKKQLEQQFKNDCNTYAIVVKNLLKKDPSLEKQIRIALIEQMDDIEKQMMDKLDAVVDALI